MTTTKQRGDAGEHYVAAMLGFAGHPVSIMPDNWPGYDLMVDALGRQLRVQVKTLTRSAFEGTGWNPGVSPETPYDFLAVLVADGQHGTEGWLLPVDIVQKWAHKPKAEAKSREWWLPKKYLKNELAEYRNRWDLLTH
ncbi:group I intron-associated PD-(D/E)XK endonuclease [Pseudomonadota bacterium]